MIAENKTGSFATVNGLTMYFEVHGEGKPLVLIHGGGSNIHTTFGKLIPLLAKSRQLIAMDLQAHGRTPDRETPLSFQQDADDVAALLQHCQIPKADILGFSNGGQTAIEIALRHPGMVNKLVLASIMYKREALPSSFWEGFDHATLQDMPQALQDGFLQVNNNKEALLTMFNRDVERMKNFSGWTDEQMRSIKAPTLLMNANADVGSPEHAVEMYRLIPHCELMILPGGHGGYLGAVESPGTIEQEQACVAGLIGSFLDKE